MPKPTGAIVIIWRDLAAEGYTYAEIARKYPKYSVNQIRHYCLGNTGRRLPGPIQTPGRWKGHNVWLQGEKSPHAGMSRAQALEVLEDWDPERERWRRSASHWARVLGVSPSAIQQLRRGDTWQFLSHPNQRRNREAKAAEMVARAAEKEARGAERKARGVGKEAPVAPARKRSGKAASPPAPRPGVRKATRRRPRGEK